MLLLSSAVGCKDRSPDHAAAATSVTSPAAALASATTPDELPVGAKVTVCVRRVPPGNPFSAQGAFACKGELTTVKAPYGTGGVTGAALVAAIRPVAGADHGEIRARKVEAGKAPGEGSGMITVSDDSNEYYDRYVVMGAGGELRVYVDVDEPS